MRVSSSSRSIIVRAIVPETKRPRSRRPSQSVCHSSPSPDHNVVNESSREGERRLILHNTQYRGAQAGLSRLNAEYSPISASTSESILIMVQLSRASVTHLSLRQPLFPMGRHDEFGHRSSDRAQALRV